MPPFRSDPIPDDLPVSSPPESDFLRPGELETISWVGRVRDAIDERRIRFHAQPIVSLRGEPVSYELLCRMESHGGKLIPPDKFMSAAETYGLIEELDLIGVREAVRLISLGHRISVNVSTATMKRENVVEEIIDELGRAGANPLDLTIEITETALMESIACGEHFAAGLSRVGIGIALDDFGTGFGGFTYLKRLPISRLKIDVEFVRDLGSSPASRRVVEAVVALARGFLLETVAEGVEDEESAALLAEIGVSHVQGFHFSRPRPIGDIVERSSSDQLQLCLGGH